MRTPANRGGGCHRAWLPSRAGTLVRYQLLLEQLAFGVGPPGVRDRGLQKGEGPMAIKPEGQQTEKADRTYNRVRWLGPLYTIYKIVREFLAT